MLSTLLPSPFSFFENGEGQGWGKYPSTIHNRATLQTRKGSRPCPHSPPSAVLHRQGLRSHSSSNSRINSARMRSACLYAAIRSGDTGTNSTDNSTLQFWDCIHVPAYAWITARLRVVRVPCSSTSKTSGNLAHRHRIAHSIRQSL